VFELMLTTLDVAPESAADDPFVGFTDTQPLFTRTADGARYQISESRRGFFAEDSFTAEKSSRTFRIFAVGGSTVQGRPFSVATSFTQFLEDALILLYPDRHWEVVNCGGISYASYRLIPIIEECLTYEPDLIVVCTGHNEFLERIEFTRQQSTAPAIPELFQLFVRFRTFRLLRGLVVADDVAKDENAPIAVLPMEADALLDHAGGLDAYHRDNAYSADVVRQFESNLSRMIALTRQADVPVLIMMPPSNLADSPPFKSEFSESASATDRRQISQLLNAAADAEPGTAVASLQMALQLDDGYAMSHYLLGRALEAQGNYEQASLAFQAAIDRDICPLRMSTALRNAMRSAVEKQQVPMLDLHQLICDLSAHGLPGNQLLVDHIHPSFVGHQRVAFAILEWMESTSLVSAIPRDAFDRCRRLWTESIQQLDSIYFLRGQRALRDLRGWAAGRVGEPPSPDSQSHQSTPP